MTETAQASNARSRLTVLVAGAANLVIAVAKLVAGWTAGSAAMLAEAAHSLADTLNEGFLLAAVHRSNKAADRTHPFGYGMERYFWSLLAAVGIFVLGAGFAVYQGVMVLVVGAPRSGPPYWSYAVLAVAFVVEGTSLVRALWQLRTEAAAQGTRPWRYLVDDAEPTLRAVVSEDSVALLGIFIAAAGLTLKELTGDETWDGIASLLIGALLALVAVGLGRQNQQYLVGKALPRHVQRAVAAHIESAEGIDGMLELLSMRLGPDDVLVAARVDLAQGRSGDEFERVADEIEARIQSEFPEVRHVFLDPTPPHA
jgi:cation diffusion facilitator family transporter